MKRKNITWLITKYQTVNSVLIRLLDLTHMQKAYIQVVYDRHMTLVQFRIVTKGSRAPIQLIASSLIICRSEGVSRPPRSLWPCWYHVAAERHVGAVTVAMMTPLLLHTLLLSLGAKRGPRQLRRTDLLSHS